MYAQSTTLGVCGTRSGKAASYSYDVFRIFKNAIDALSNTSLPINGFEPKSKCGRYVPQSQRGSPGSEPGRKPAHGTGMGGMSGIRSTTGARSALALSGWGSLL